MIDGPVLQSANIPFDGHRRDLSTPRDSAPATLLVAENDVKVAVPLVIELQEEGYTVLHAVDGHWALKLARAAHPDLVLLDVRLPRMDGLAVCRTLRRTSTVPIILLTAPEQERERIRGLELGADACLVKPFDVRELLSRVAVVLRRCDLGNGNGTPPPDSIVVGDIILDRTTCQVWQAGQPIHLRRREFDPSTSSGRRLLSVLMENTGKAIPRRELLNRVWGKGWVGNPRTLDVHTCAGAGICWLREKLEEDPSTPCYIQTLRGYGHRFVEPAKKGRNTIMQT